MSKKIDKTLASLLFAFVTSGGGSKMH